jgi:hypothetical protein
MTMLVADWPYTNITESPAWILAHGHATLTNPRLEYAKRNPTIPIPAASNNTLWADRELAKKVIGEYSELPENWDGYGALKINEKTKKNALTALDQVSRDAPVPDITPNTNGTISFEWESEYGVAHLEIGKTKYSFYVKPNIGNPTLGDGFAERMTSDVGQAISALLFPAANRARTISSVCTV